VPSSAAPTTTAPTYPGIQAQVMIRPEIFIDDALSKTDQEWLAQEYTTLLRNHFGTTLDEGYLGDSWIVSIVNSNDSLVTHQDKDTRRQPKISYYAEGMANVYEDGQFWATAPFRQESFARDLESTLQSHGFPGATVNTYPWPLVAGNTLFAFGYVRPNLVDPELTQMTVEGNSAEDEGGSETNIAILIGLILGAIVLASLVGLVVYYELRRRKMIGHMNVPLTNSQDEEGPDPCAYVDHIAEHQVADLDVSLSDSGCESSEQTDNQVLDGSPRNSTSSFDGMSHLVEIDLSADSQLTDGDLSLWDHDTGDIAFAAEFFKVEEPILERSSSSNTDSGTYASSA